MWRDIAGKTSEWLDIVDVAVSVDELSPWRFGEQFFEMRQP
jgi:hypothetical protein